MGPSFQLNAVIFQRHAVEACLSGHKGIGVKTYPELADQARVKSDHGA